MADHSRSSSGSDQSYHSAAGEEDNWVHSKNIGTGGFGVVKLFINRVSCVSMISFTVIPDTVTPYTYNIGRFMGAVLHRKPTVDFAEVAIWWH